MESAQKQGPERIRKPFDMLFRVEHKTLAFRKVSSVAERDVRIVGDVSPEEGLNRDRQEETGEKKNGGAER